MQYLLQAGVLGCLIFVCAILRGNRFFFLEQTYIRTIYEHQNKTFKTYSDNYIVER